jgi:hypothetical protein
MGNRGDVYERYYMPNFVDKDCLAIFLGTTRRDDLVRAVGRLERHSRAPHDLNDAQRAEIRNHPELIELPRCRERYTAKIKRCGYQTEESRRLRKRKRVRFSKTVKYGPPNFCHYSSGAHARIKSGQPV